MYAVRKPCIASSSSGCPGARSDTPQVAPPVEEVARRRAVSRIAAAANGNGECAGLSVCAAVGDSAVDDPSFGFSFFSGRARLAAPTGLKRNCADCGQYLHNQHGCFDAPS